MSKDLCQRAWDKACAEWSGTTPEKTPDVHHYCALHPYQENAYVDMDLGRWACNCCARTENHMRTVPVTLAS